MVQARATAAVFPFFIFCAKEGEKKSRAKKNLVHSHFSSSPTRLESLGPLAFFVSFFPRAPALTRAGTLSSSFSALRGAAARRLPPGCIEGDRRVSARWLDVRDTCSNSSSKSPTCKYKIIGRGEAALLPQSAASFPLFLARCA